MCSIQAKRVALYLARTTPNRLFDELMNELQTVETLNCLIERTETPPFYRLTSMRKASSHSDGKSLVISHSNVSTLIPWTSETGPTAHDSRTQDLTVEKGTIHTKRHSGEDHIKNGFGKLTTIIYCHWINTSASTGPANRIVVSGRFRPIIDRHVAAKRYEHRPDHQCCLVLRTW